MQETNGWFYYAQKLYYCQFMMLINCAILVMYWDVALHVPETIHCENLCASHYHSLAKLARFI